MAKVLVTESYLDDIGDAIREQLDVSTQYHPSEMGDAVRSIEGGYPEPTGTKTITANGTGIDVKDYALADVAVPNSYAAGDEGKVVSNGALVAQTSQSITENGTYDTTTKNSVSVNVQGGGGGGVLSGDTIPSPSIGSEGDIYAWYDGLPSAYTKKEYIEASGTQYINTGIRPKYYTDIRFVYQNLNSSGWQRVVGSCTSNGSNSLGFGINGTSKITYQNHSVHSDVNVSVPVDEDIEWFIKAGQVYADEVGITGLAAPTTSINDLPMYLFTWNENGSISYMGKGRFKGDFIVYENGEIIACLIPCERNADSVVGMYDIVSGNFLTNQGTGDFAVGSTVTTKELLRMFVKKNGVWVQI